jgi:ATP-dependent Lhr-like helicase
LLRDGLPIATYAAEEVHYMEGLPENECWEVQTALLRRHTPIVLDDLAEPG